MPDDLTRATARELHDLHDHAHALARLLGDGSEAPTLNRAEALLALAATNERLADLAGRLERYAAPEVETAGR